MPNTREAATDQYIPLTPAAVRKHGPQAATVLCLIRFRCRIDAADRISAEGGRLWRASRAAIADQTGLSPDQVGRAITKLCATSALVMEHHPAHYGDQTRAYRVMPDPELWSDDFEAATGHSAKSRSGVAALTSVSAKPRQPIPRNRINPFGEIAESSSTKEGLRRGEEPQQSDGVSPAPVAEGHHPPIEPSTNNHDTAPTQASAGSLEQVAGTPAPVRPRLLDPSAARCPGHAGNPNPPACIGCRDARKQAGIANVTAQRAYDTARRGWESTNLQHHMSLPHNPAPASLVGQKFVPTRLREQVPPARTAAAA